LITEDRGYNKRVSKKRQVELLGGIDVVIEEGDGVESERDKSCWGRERLPRALKRKREAA
jgi:hypothetical protein